MKIRLDLVGGEARVRIVTNGVDYPELDIRTTGASIAEALAASIDRFQELQQEAIAKMREAGLLSGGPTEEARVVS